MRKHLAVCLCLAAAWPLQRRWLRRRRSEASALVTKIIELTNAGKFAEALPLAQRMLSNSGKATRPQSPRPRERAEQPGGTQSGIRSPQRGRAALSACAGNPGKGAWDQAIPMWRPRSTMSPCFIRRFGRHREAEPLYQRSLAIREKALGAGPSGCRIDAQQPRRALPGHGPACRGRAAVQALARDRRKAARTRPSPCRKLRSTAWRCFIGSAIALTRSSLCSNAR